MKKAIWILSVLLFISILIIIFLIFFQKQNITRLTKSNDEALAYYKTQIDLRDQKIQELYHSPITKETIKYIPAEKKNDIILQQQKIIDADTQIIKDLYDRLDKTNTELKKKYDFKNSFSAFVLGGLDKELEIDLYTGIKYRRILFSLPKFNMFAGFGGAVKVYRVVGGALEVELGFTF